MLFWVVGFMDNVCSTVRFIPRFSSFILYKKLILSVLFTYLHILRADLFSPPENMLLNVFVVVKSQKPGYKI